MNARAAFPLWQTLVEMEHKQPPTSIQSDNDTATGIANESIKQKHTKMIYMWFHWVQDHIRQKQFDIYWKPGGDNLAYYFSKHHPTSHYINVRTIYLKN